MPLLLLGPIRLSHLEQRRFRRQETGLSHHRPQRNPGETKWNDRQIVSVDHGLDIAASLVDLAMDVALAVQARRVGRDGFAVKSDLDNVGARHERRRHGARDEEAIGILRRARADVTEAVQNPFVREDVARRDDVLDPGLIWIARGIALSVAGRGEDNRGDEERGAAQRCLLHVRAPAWDRPRPRMFCPGRIMNAGPASRN